MGKPQLESKAIVKATKSSPLAICEDYEPKQRAILEYLALFAAIDRRELTDDIRFSYVRAICGHRPELSLRQVEKGLVTYLATGDKWPWPGTLLEMMEEEV